MAVTEESRYRLYKQLEETLGAEHSNTLMEHLPPVGWADVATKSDIQMLRSDMDQLEERMSLRFEALEHRFDGALAAGLHRQFVQVVTTMTAVLTVMLTLAVAVNQLLGG